MNSSPALPVDGFTQPSPYSLLTYVIESSWSFGLTIVRISEMLRTGSSIEWLVFSGIMVILPTPRSIARLVISSKLRGNVLSVYSSSPSSTGSSAQLRLIVSSTPRLRE